MDIDIDAISPIYLKLFKGREDCFAGQAKHRYYPIHQAFNGYYLARHIFGDATFGIFPLTKESYCHLLCIDIDIPKAELDKVDISDEFKKFSYSYPQLKQLRNVLTTNFKIPEASMLLEDTGGRGYHLWIFLSKPILGTEAVAFGEAIKKLVELEFEFFPRQGRLTPKCKYGNLIKLPLGIHRDYLRISRFFIIQEDKPVYYEDVEKNIAALKEIEPIDSLVITTAAGTVQGELLLGDELLQDPLSEKQRYHYSGTPSTLISNCDAMRNISKKAESGIGLDRREAFHYANIMLSVSGGVNEIHSVMKSSYGVKYDPEKTNKEIENILPLRPTSCKLLVNSKLCPKYCKSSVQRQNEDPIRPNTIPCSVWLKREIVKEVEFPQDIREQIGTSENISMAFYKLKRYYAEEITIFFDRFDFDLFEDKINEYSRTISEALLQQIELPFTGYLPSLMPKKLNDKLELQYRRMAYSSVFDQVPIQSVFNILGPIIDSKFHKCSYGYRWNRDDRVTHRIFNDWKDYYPQFRNDVITSLQENPKGYHICCDIKGYYDNVRHDILLQQLRNAIPDDYIYQIVERYVSSYEYEKGIKKGIPQGPAYARLLANLYLNKFDHFISQICPGYFRYVDDFVLVFDSHTRAEEGLNQIVRQLDKLGLVLSQDGEKKPTIMENTDLTRVRKTLDKIRYGILENAKYVRRLDTETINEFYSAVERKNVNISNPDEFIKINDALLSLLFVVSQEMLIPHPLRERILKISEYMIQKHWFFPKKVGKIFGKLLEMDPDKQKYVKLFDYLESAHKCYFLLSLYYDLPLDAIYKPLLVSLLKKSVFDDDQFVSGISLAIIKDANLYEEIGCNTKSILDRLEKSRYWYEIVRYLGKAEYLTLTSEEKSQFRKIINNNQPEIVKLLLLGSITQIPGVLLDEIYLGGFIDKFQITLVPVVASLLSLFTNRSGLMDSIVSFLTSDPRIKPIVITFVADALNKVCATSGLSEIENLRQVFANLEDPELKRVILRVLSQNTYEDTFYRTHRLIDHQNRCLFFEHLENVDDYNYVEIIPEEVIKEQLHMDVVSLMHAIEYLSQETTILPAEFFYDSSTHEVYLRYTLGAQRTSIVKSEYSIEDSNSVIKILKIALDAYKKAIYFKRILGKTPMISFENLVIDNQLGNVLFKSIGSSLQTPIVIAENKLGEGEEEIPYMVAMLIRDLLFESPDMFEIVSKQTYKRPIVAFVVQVVKNMYGPEPSHRYSAPRLEYLVESLRAIAKLSDYEIGAFYLRERLRSALFRHNQEIVTWHGICRAIEEHTTSILDICSSEVLHDLRISNRLFASLYDRVKLHYLSRQLINIILNRKVIEKRPNIGLFYGDLLEYLLLVSSLCLELTSFSRSLYDGNNPDRARLINSITMDRVKVQASDYEQNISKKELVEVLMYNPDETGIDIIEMPLKEISLLIMLSLGSSFSDGILTIVKPKKISWEQFDNISHICLIELPRIEEKLQQTIQELSDALFHNDEPTLNIHIVDVQEQFKFVMKSFRVARRKLRIARYYGFADARKFPEKINCSSLSFRRKAKINNLPGIKITNSFPSSRYRCSWDVRNGEITCLIIPSTGIQKVIDALVKGKVFGYKTAFIYSGKLMIFWDLGIFAVVYLSASLCKYGESTLTNTYLQAMCSIGSSVFSTIAKGVLLKLLYDLALWIPFLRKMIEDIKKAWKNNEGEVKVVS